MSPVREPTRAGPDQPIARGAAWACKLGVGVKVGLCDTRDTRSIRSIISTHARARANYSVVRLEIHPSYDVAHQKSLIWPDSANAGRGARHVDTKKHLNKSRCTWSGELQTKKLLVSRALLLQLPLALSYIPPRLAEFPLARPCQPKSPNVAAPPPPPHQKQATPVVRMPPVRWPTHSKAAAV